MSNVVVSREVDKNGVIRYFDCTNKMKYHREDGPAVIFPNGTAMFYKNGQATTDYGPSIIWANGTKFYHKIGILHNSNGPAIIFNDNSELYCINGNVIEKEMFDILNDADKQFDEYKLPKNLNTIHGYNIDFNILIGRKIISLEVSKGEQYIKFNTTVGPFVFETLADCCSETWFAEIMNVSNLIGQTITKVEDISIKNRIDDGNSRQKCDRFYGHRLHTIKGDCLIVYRNSSNGFYGGTMSFVRVPETDDSLKKAQFKQVCVDDWTAY